MNLVDVGIAISSHCTHVLSCVGDYLLKLNVGHGSIIRNVWLLLLFNLIA